MKAEFKSKLFGPGKFYKEVIAIALPVMLQALIQNLVALVDNFMVQGLGDIKMSGVNIAGQYAFVFMVIVNTICMSGGIFMSQFFGANDKKGMKQAFIFKFILGIVGVAVFMTCFLVFPRQLLSLMVHNNADADSIINYGVQYIQIMAFMGAQYTIANIIASSLREIGIVKPPLFIAVGATLVNTFLDWILIYGKFGIPRLEVRGAAIATVIATTLQMIVFIIYVLIKKPPFLISIKDIIQIDWVLFFKMLKKSLMIFFSEMLWVSSETVTTALYNSRGGAEVVSGMASSFAIANLFFVAFGGITTATGVILGKTLGHGDLEEARKKKNWLLTSAFIFGLLMTVFGFIASLLIPVVFGNLSSESQRICRNMVWGMSLLMPAWVYVNAQFAVSRAGGDTLMGMLVDGITTLLLVIPGMVIMTLFTPLGPVTMYMIIKSSDFIKIAMAQIWLSKEKWLKNLTTQ